MWSSGLLVWMCCLVSTTAQVSLPYGARNGHVTPSEMVTVLNAAKANILQVAARNDTSAGVTMQLFTVAANPEYVPYAYYPFTAAQASNVKRFVKTAAQAFAECAAYFPCGAVHVYRTITRGTDFYVAMYYSQTNKTYGVVWNQNVAVDPDADLVRGWVGSGIPYRYAGIECDNPYVDTVWFYRTWSNQFTSQFMDVSSLGIPNSVTDTGLSSYASSIQRYFDTFGHQYRLWPNPRCPLTPLTVDPYSFVVPTHTVAPLNFRNRIVALNAFAPSPTTQVCACAGGCTIHIRVSHTGDIHTGVRGVVCAGGCTIHIRVSHTGVWVCGMCVQAEVIHTAPVASIDAVSGVVRLTNGFIFNYYSTLRFAEGAHIDRKPCGEGYLAHSTVHGRATCICPFPVGADDACQFNQQNCKDSISGEVCAGRGICQFNRSAIAWRANNPFNTQAVLQCVCPPPYVPPTCAHSACWRGNTTNVDCLLDNTASACIGSTLNTGVCVCRPGRLGVNCEIDDSVRQKCIIRSDSVEGLTSTTETLVCSGRGTCTIDATGVPLGCACAHGYMGARCELFYCSHTETCGRYGTCLRTSEAGTGRPHMTCQCARLLTDDSVWIATFFNGVCSVDDCGMGVTVIDTTVGVTDYRTPLRGHCECFAITNGTIGRGWINIPSAVGITSGNTGDKCETPQCPYFTDAAGKSVSFQCNVPSTPALKSICLPCAMFPGAGSCTQTFGFGGVCDCDGYWTALMQPTSSDKNNKITALFPYWARASPPERFTTSADHTNPMCEKYCKNSGTWSFDTTRMVGSCTCPNPGDYAGERCDVLKCPHGSPGTGTLCTSCNLGWAPPTECTHCADGYIGANCAYCAPGYFNFGGECTSCSREAAESRGMCNPITGATIDISCSDSTGITCICGAGYTGPTCSSCVTGNIASYLDPTNRLVVTCIDCLSQLACIPAATIAYSCDTANPTCICADPSTMDPTAGCACNMAPDGAPYYMVMTTNGRCVTSTVALGCYDAGTAGSGYFGCVCNTGYGGTLCAVCASGYTRDPNSVNLVCIPCAQRDCGKYGSVLCSGSSSSTGCDCKNGYSGPVCTTCSNCGGVGGTCNTAPPGANVAWCVCGPNYTIPSMSTAALHSAGYTSTLQLPCTACKTRYIPFNGACVLVVDVCGPAASIDLSSSSKTCRCGPGFIDPPPSGRCDSCLSGFVGPLCIACNPPCNHDGGTCVWRPDPRGAGGMVAGCACDLAHAPPNCNSCQQGYVGPPCTACPVRGCGIGGTCVLDQTTYIAICHCTGQYQNEQGDPTLPCNTCSSLGSPLTCSDCSALNCSANSRCSEHTPGQLTCDCVDGYRRLKYYSGMYQSSTLAGCFPIQLANEYDTMLDTAGIYASPVSASINGIVYPAAVGTAVLIFVILAVYIKCRVNTMM